MFVLTWANLLFSVMGSIAFTGASVEGITRCINDFCITLNDGEITAEAGLCVVLPCYFSTNYYFTPQNLVWYQCHPSKARCGDQDIILHTNTKKVQPRFVGRVSLLYPDLTWRSCSIIVNDLTESDSGLYQLRVNGYRGSSSDGFTFSPRATLSVKGLTQKPMVTVPSLTEGQLTTLTCTAPGLCSGSAPQITWTWRGAGETDRHITGNLTAFETETLTAIAQRHSSTLTFNTSAEHHNTDVTCKVSFTNGITTEETVTLNVTYVKEVKITGRTSVKEGESLNVTCSVESFPPSLVMWTKTPDKNMQNGTESNLQNDTLTDLQNDTLTDLQNDTLTDLQNSTETFPQEESGTSTVFIRKVTTEDSGLYTCTAKYQNKTLTKIVDVTVIYVKNPVIAGDTTVTKGNALNLTCSVESVPPSHVAWTKLGSDTEPYNDTEPQNHTGSATLLIPNVMVEDSGRYICTVQHLDTTLTRSADVTVTWLSMFSSPSGCVAKSEVMTCVCISEGFPLPTIKWPMLEKPTEYSVITTVSKHTVNSTATLAVKDLDGTSVECFSSNGNAEGIESLTIRRDNEPEKDAQFEEVFSTISWLQVIIAFFIGVLLSAAIFLAVKKCHRNKQKGSGNVVETLALVTSQEDPLIDTYEAVEEGQSYYQEAVEEDGVSAFAEQASPDLNGVPKEVEYANIDFTALRRNNLREAAKKPETTETEYAEIKSEVKEQRQDNGAQEGDALEGKEEEAMIREEEEANPCAPEEEEAEEVEEEEAEEVEVEEAEEAEEDMAVYSNLKDIMGDI